MLKDNNISILWPLLKISSPKSKILYLLEVISLRAMFSQNAGFK